MLPHTGLRMYSRDQRGVAPADCWNRDKWGLTEYKWSGPSVVGSLGSSCRNRRFLSCLGCSGQPQFKIIFSSQHTFSLYVSPSASKLGRRRAGSPVSEYVSPAETRAKASSPRKNCKLLADERWGREREFWVWGLLCCVTVSSVTQEWNNY
jgi:hypothetical protein